MTSHRGHGNSTPAPAPAGLLHYDVIVSGILLCAALLRQGATFPLGFWSELPIHKQLRAVVDMNKDSSIFRTFSISRKPVHVFKVIVHYFFFKCLFHKGFIFIIDTPDLGETLRCLWRKVPPLSYSLAVFHFRRPLGQ